LLLGRAFTWHDDKDSPRVAVVNAEFAREIFGSAQKAIGGYYKLPDGTHIQVVGISENGKLLPTGHSTYRGGLESIFPCSERLAAIQNLSHTGQCPNSKDKSL
jgi:hypothetical protein